MRLVVAATLALAAPVVAQPVPILQPNEALLSVQAEGVQRSPPDMMTITAGAVTTGVTASEAVQSNAALAQRLTAAVRGAGVRDRDIRTSSFRVEPRLNNNRGGDVSDGRTPQIVGYVAYNRFQVRMRDLRSAETVIAKMFEAGANSVGEPVFSLVDDTAARRAAERAAIAAARSKAENYAAPLGKRVGRLLRITDRQISSNGNYGEIIVARSSFASAPTPVEPGELEIKATVFVDFALID